MHGFKQGDGYEQSRDSHLAFGVRFVKASFIDAEAAHEEKELERKVRRCREAGLDEAANWFESALCAVRGARRELSGE